jgi:hypothetical protein
MRKKVQKSKKDAECRAQEGKTCQGATKEHLTVLAERAERLK